MNEGEIVLINMIQSDGASKVRPALILKILPKYGDLLVCGISSKLKQELKGIDELLDSNEDYFAVTGLRQSSVIRLLFVGLQQSEQVLGRIGNISENLLRELLERLAKFLVS